MLLRYFSFLLIFLTVHFAAISQNIEWAKSFTGSNNPTVYSYDLDKDVNNNIYMAGQFSGSVDFNPGATQKILTSTGTAFDLFFAKYDINGNYLWAKKIGTNNYSTITKILVANSGHLYICGMFAGTVDFDPNAGVATFSSTPADAYNAFFAKYDTDGNFIKAVCMGGSSGNVVTDMELDNANNIIITGGFNETVDFDPSPGVANLSSSGGSDIFFAKYDADGAYIFAKSVGGADHEANSLIELDGNNTIYLSGQFKLTSDFDPGSSTFNLTSLGVHDIFFASYDQSGNFTWAKSVGSNSTELNSCLKVYDNHIYLAVRYSGMIDFDPDAPVFNLTGPESGSHFFGKYNNSGVLQWGKTIGEQSVIGYDLSIDSEGRLFFTGRNLGTNDFDPSNAVINITGTDDFFFAAYDNSGNYLNAFNIGGATGNGISDALLIDDAGNLYLTGYFDGNPDFDHGAGTHTLAASTTGMAGFLVKYSPAVTGIFNTNNEQQVEVFPNPAQMELTIIMSEWKDCQIQITDIRGSIIFTESITGNKKTIPLDVNPGIYFLLVKNKEGKVYNKKIIVE